MGSEGGQQAGLHGVQGTYVSPGSSRTSAPEVPACCSQPPPLPQGHLSSLCGPLACLASFIPRFARGSPYGCMWLRSYCCCGVGFPSLGTIGIWGQIILHCWRRGLYCACRMASTRHVEGRTPSQVATAQNVSNIARCPLGGQNCP